MVGGTRKVLTGRSRFPSFHESIRSLTVAYRCFLARLMLFSNGENKGPTILYRVLSLSSTWEDGEEETYGLSISGNILILCAAITTSMVY